MKSKSKVEDERHEGRICGLVMSCRSVEGASTRGCGDKWRGFEAVGVEFDGSLRRNSWSWMGK